MGLAGGHESGSPGGRQPGDLFLQLGTGVLDNEFCLTRHSRQDVEFPLADKVPLGKNADPITDFLNLFQEV